MNPTIEALLNAAGYPTPPTAEDAVRMLLSEIEGARAMIDRADDQIASLKRDLARRPRRRSSTMGSPDVP